MRVEHAGLLGHLLGHIVATCFQPLGRLDGTHADPMARAAFRERQGPPKQPRRGGGHAPSLAENSAGETLSR